MKGGMGEKSWVGKRELQLVTRLTSRVPWNEGASRWPWDGPRRVKTSPHRGQSVPEVGPAGTEGTAPARFFCGRPRCLALVTFSQGSD